MKAEIQRSEAISGAVEALKPELFSFLQQLVQTPSLPDHELAAQELVAQKLAGLGLQVDWLDCRFDELKSHPAFNDDGFSPDGRSDVIGRWSGSPNGDPGQGTLILNGHVDVVSPGDETLWEASPWSGIIREGRLYGRGACDMKAGLSAGIFAIQALQNLGFRPARDVLVESVIGEESGGVGTLATILKGYKADAALILEPTGLQICPVQAGALTFRLRVPGLATHAALKKHGVSAIEKFAILLRAIQDLEIRRHQSYSNPLFDEPDQIAPINIGTVHGGRWHSTVPEEVVAEGRMGVFPGESTGVARQALAEALQTACCHDPWLREHPPVLEWFEGQFESGETPVNHPLITALSAAQEKLLGAVPQIKGVTYGSDLRLFTNHAHIPAVLYGPGDVRLAHAANEFAPLDEVAAATKVIAQTVSEWCGGSLD